MTVNQTWLSFSITPVQGFISASRSVRDLAVSSELLGHMVGAAIDAGWSYGGELLFPYIERDEGTRKPHIPNKFIMLFDSKDKADEAEQVCRAAAEKAWRDIADAVYNELDKRWSKHAKWDEDWQRQVDNYWDMRSFVMEPPTQEYVNRLLGDTFKADDLKSMWRIAAAVEGASKHTRFFPRGIGGEVPKCTMFGDWDQMGPRAALSVMNDFWKQATSDKPISGLMIGEAERLCAIALIKRFAAAVPSAWDGKFNSDLKAAFSDTASIALAAWRRSVDDYPQIAAAISRIDNIVKDLARDTGVQSPDRIILTGARGLEKEIQYPENHQEQLDAITAALSAMHAACKKSDFPAPSPYYALLKIDVDKLGKLLSGADLARPLDMSYYQELSKRMQGYASEAKSVIEQANGRTVYAGGDDILALMPVENVFECATKLHDIFPALVDDVETTVSGAIVIAHYKENLRGALSTLGSTLDKAKESGRNACAIAVWKRSGAPVETVVGWGMLSTLRELHMDLVNGASDGWVSMLSDKVRAPITMEGRHTLGEIQMWLLVNCFLGHSRGEVPSAQDKLKVDVKSLWKETHSFMKNRFDRCKDNYYLSDEYPDPTSGSIFNFSLLNKFISAVKTASFLARKR